MEREEIKERFLRFVDEIYKTELSEACLEGKECLEIDFSKLDLFDVELADLLLEKPEEILEIFEDALKEIEVDLPENFRVRFFNLPESRQIRIRNLRAEHIGKLISVEGIVVRASEVRPEIEKAVFSCLNCGAQITVVQTERTMKEPKKCSSCGNKRDFVLIDQKLYDARWIVIEEPFEIVEAERPSTLMVYLKEDLTNVKLRNKTDPGNRIRITGILKQIQRKLKGSRSKQLEIYLEANHVEPLETEWEELEITEEDERKILELAKDPNIYEKLVRSIAPGIYGLEHVKEAIALQLFAGVPKILPDGSRIRGDIHLLLIGDPSTAKSQILKTVSKLMPRARYVSGKGVSGVGLTAAVTRDEEFFGGWVLEAGALVLCNKSVLCIDEFEKVEKNDQIALHEALEQQSISIAKANIVATLPAQTAILAGGNPKLGRFDPYIPIKEQVDIPETLLARFDLKFALRDKPDPERDSLIADYILRTRHFEEAAAKPEIEPELLRKYIAYARKNCKPKLTKEAGEKIKEFFVNLRAKASEEEAPIPITLRQYEALIRLAEASAKIQLRDEVNVEDAERAIRLMKISLREFGFDPETGHFDIDRAEGQRVTAAQRSKIRKMLDIIDELTALQGAEIDRDEILRKAREEGIDNAEEILNKMLREGLIFSPRANKISKL
jgi:replicative DNA helicase Mcm